MADARPCFRSPAALTLNAALLAALPWMTSGCDDGDTASAGEPPAASAAPDATVKMPGDEVDRAPEQDALPNDPPTPDAPIDDAGRMDAPDDPPPDEPQPDEPPPDEPPPDMPPPEACPEGVICLEGPDFEHRGDTTHAARRFDAYGCAPDTDESGPEVMYRLDLAEGGFLALELGDMQMGADVDIHLLEADDPTACIDRGHWRAGQWLPAGRYWLVADTWVDEVGTAYPGAYTLTGHLTTAADLEAEGIAPQLASDALYAFGVGWSREETARFDYAIIDFSMHSSDARQWVFDLLTGDLLWRLHVAHGEASSDPNDPAWSVVFSNIPESHQSSLGMIRTAESYVGDWGISYRLDGLEPGFNDNVRRRDIVMHPWEESRPEYVNTHGITGTTWGCPGIDDRVAPAVVDRLADGTLMFFWHPGSNWHRQSAYIPR
ncbi:MAG: murein L,D-transpeptidase catalytic domain family protein [Bradymonadia bacterium]